ncbi:MAG: AEC family transporter [Marvinbryantia sp.]|uniref:AEC family transporter n=1 Tax=Marvinbryantia sp. TaxID=2496532 RepID=UPI0025DA6270|nr:AEC family transporter [uncultured Marvinbryantia sp.]
MGLRVVEMVLPVLLMIGIGYFCNRRQIFDMNGLKGLKALLGDIMLPVVLFNAFFTASYSLRVVVVFLVVYLGFGAAIALGFLLRPLVKPYGKYLPFLVASAEGGMLGYALYGLITGSQSGFAAVDLGQTVFAYTVWLGLLTSVDGGEVKAEKLLKNMISNKCFLGMVFGIVLGAAGVGNVVMNSAAGGIVKSVVSMITAPVSAVVLLMVGYELNLKKELFLPVLKTIVLRLVIMGALLLVSNLVIFRIFPFDKELEIALMVLYALPAPFIIPIFSDVGKDGEYVATTLSVHTLVTVALYAAIVVYSL